MYIGTSNYISKDNLERMAESRDTSVEIMQAIAEVANNLDDLRNIWAEGINDTDKYHKIEARAWELALNGTEVLYWGKRELHRRDSFMACWERLAQSTGTRTQVELASFLGIRQSCISDSLRRRSIPDAWLLTVMRKTDINPDWILGTSSAKYRPAVN